MIQSAIIMKIQVHKAKYGSGGDYMSNEIFYKVAMTVFSCHKTDDHILCINNSVSYS